MLDVRIGTALEVGHVEEVQVRVVGHDLRRCRICAVVPEHVGSDARVSVPTGQEVHGDDVDAVVGRSFAGCPC